MILKNATQKEIDALQVLAHKVLANPTKLTTKYLERLVIFLKFKFPKFAQLKIFDVHNLIINKLILLSRHFFLTSWYNKEAFLRCIASLYRTPFPVIILCNTFSAFCHSGRRLWGLTQKVICVPWPKYTKVINYPRFDQSMSTPLPPSWMTVLLSISQK